MRLVPKILAASLLAVSLLACSDDDTNEAAAGTVTVTVTDIEGFVGNDLAAVLYDGLGVSDPDVRAIGGFGADVATDPFSTTQTIRTPLPDWGSEVEVPFPYVSDEPLVVEPGEYTIALWRAERLGPYSRWVPADSPRLGGCTVRITVEEGQPTSVTVEGIPDWTGSAPTCATR